MTKCWRFQDNRFEISNKVTKGRVSFLPSVKEDAVERCEFFGALRKTGGCNLKF